MATTDHEARFAFLIDSQNDIGWTHLLRGHFSHHWTQIQQQHITLDDDISPKQLTGAR
jgi:hypothetical protein